MGARDISPRLHNLFFGIISMILFGGCAAIPSDKLAAFSTGVTTTKGQVTTAFAAVNALTREEVISYAATQADLIDENFYDVLDPAAIAKWEVVFNSLEKYSQSLIVLTSPDMTKEYKGAVVELASQINETGGKLKQAGVISKGPTFSPGIATAFAELGNVLMKAKATSDAKTTLRTVDPTVQKILQSMADMIDPIRNTVHVHWRDRKDTKSLEFRKAPESEKRSKAIEYADMKEKEAAQDQVLASLQRSLRSLANAHHALAQDSKTDVVAAVAIIKDEAKDTKDFYDRMKIALPQSETTGNKNTQTKEAPSKP